MDQAYAIARFRMCSGAQTIGYRDRHTTEKLPLTGAQILLAIAMWGLLVIPALVCSWMAIQSYSERQTASVPLVSAVQMRSMLAKAAHSLETIGTVDDYVSAIRESSTAGNLFRRFDDAHGDIDMRIMAMRMDSLRNDALIHATNTFGGEAIRNAVDRHGGSQFILASENNDKYWSWGNTGLALLLGYLASILVALAFFTSRVRMLSGYHWLVDGANIVVAAISWPVAMWNYPTVLPVVERLARAKRRAVGCITAMLTFAPMGAFAKSGDAAEGASESAHTMLLGEIPVPKLSASVGIESDKVVNNGAKLHLGPVHTWSVNAAFDGGWAFDFAGTKSLSNANSSDELDVEAFKSGALSPTLQYTFGLHYYDVRPWKQVANDNFYALSLSLDQEVGSGIHVFAYAEYNYVSVHAENSGYSVKVGATRSFDLGHGITFAPTAALVQAGGPFHMKPATLARVDASLTFPLTDSTSVNVWGKAFLPLAGANDRRNAAVGVSFAYAAN